MSELITDTLKRDLNRAIAQKIAYRKKFEHLEAENARLKAGIEEALAMDFALPFAEPEPQSGKYLTFGLFIGLSIGVTGCLFLQSMLKEFFG